MELEKICIEGINHTYAISNVMKEFRKAVDEPWKKVPPWQRYQKKLIADLTVLEEKMEGAIEYQNFERLSVEEKIYSIRHSKTKKNVRVLYTIYEGYVILLTAFLEKNEGDYKRAIDTAITRLKWLQDD